VASAYRFGVVALLPELVLPVLDHGVVGRAASAGLIDFRCRSPREFATDVHRTVDDRPYGGGPGMVLRYTPVRDAIRALRQEMPSGSREIVLSAQGRVLDQGLVRELARAPGTLMVAGRYEGIDERIVESEVPVEVSLGDYVLSGGELPAAVVIDAVTRLLPGVLGDAESPELDSFSDGILDYPQYTRPEEVDGMAVPGVLLGGDHEAIRRWRLKAALGRTWLRRPELLDTRSLSAEEKELLDEFRSEQSRG
jgi:tRNA (guanine37-N1)-methyltransferase